MECMIWDIFGKSQFIFKWTIKLTVSQSEIKYNFELLDSQIPSSKRFQKILIVYESYHMTHMLNRQCCIQTAINENLCCDISIDCLILNGWCLLHLSNDVFHQVYAFFFVADQDSSTSKLQTSRLVVQICENHGHMWYLDYWCISLLLVKINSKHPDGRFVWKELRIGDSIIWTGLT